MDSALMKMYLKQAVKNEDDEFSLKTQTQRPQKERSIYGLRIRSHLGGTPGQQPPLHMAGNQFRTVCL
jgi:hypothetical protein